MYQELLRPQITVPAVNELMNNSWTVSRGLRPSQVASRVSKNPSNSALRPQKGHAAVEMGFLDNRIKGYLLNDDYWGLLQAAGQVLEIDSHCAEGWLQTAVALLGIEGISTKSPFLDTELLTPEKRSQLWAALRALHTATTCQASPTTMAEIHVMKALARFALGQVQGAYHDLQISMRHFPGFAMTSKLMQHSAMQTLKRVRISNTDLD